MNNYYLPTQFEIEDEPFVIRNKGDYRTVLSCFNIISDIDLSDYEKSIALLLLFFENFDDVDDVLRCPYQKELLEKMFWFFDCGQDYSADRNKPSLIDWDKDSMLVSSAINAVAGKDVRAEEFVHWWTFIGYYMAIDGDCALATIVTIRNKIARNEKLEKHEKKFKQENPHYFIRDYRTQEDKQVDDYIQALWDSNGGE